jgi:hypothetical protein
MRTEPDRRLLVRTSVIAALATVWRSPCSCAGLGAGIGDLVA